MEKVVITGMGIISSLGNSPELMFENLEKGVCAFRSEPEWEQYVGLETHVSAPAHAYDVSALPRQCRRSMSPMSEMGYIAAVDALKDAQLTVGRDPDINNPFFRPDPMKVGLILGSTSGSPVFLESYFKKMFENGGPKGQMSTSFFKVMNHSVAANVALALDYSGPLISPSSACSTSSQAAILAMQLIRAGVFDVAIVGGADELHYTSVAVFDTVKASAKNYNHNPQMIPGPFAANRDGLVVSEGAGVIILESESHAKKRKAKVYAEISGGAYFCDGIHMSQPQADQMAVTMNQALKDAGLSASQIDYVNAHATGTQVGDEQEVKGIMSVFPEQKIPVSSLKGHFGHSLAACGVIEIIAIIEMMKNKKVIGNRNVTEVPEGFNKVDILTENKKAAIQYALSNNFAFGGMNTSLILKNLL
ncbi:beta-ketoacyl synthase N-terminal-like domain-containing protein [Bacteriovorax sp. PP10]|uniref:Beta-ketoacyl synthase N-terminal-like domain-containing protein n=1 Tax=Bacteriovorax antarcticus TaxID=3088717 RepID=A0ABU5VVU3_9BACT|nr:beta-ketoacyl synthase N-terminal-like domain-containing protein [Bacteriovorax sp. PP10]MEA9357183.1 beta-ketoacyl synthase N-terminal-like domain-containing protein [Bacteriovorax sp. PP10]